MQWRSGAHWRTADRDFGLMHIRLPTWFPFTVQIDVNGHSWLKPQLTRRRLGFTACDNASTAVADPVRTQKLRPSPAASTRCLANLLQDMTYYWLTDQAEYTTDFLFHDTATLASRYPQYLEHATRRFRAEDVMTFLDRKLTA